MPQASVHQVFQSHDGYLWLATEGGVARFDSVGFKVYAHENLPAFTSDDVSAIAETSNGVLWFGTADGLIRKDSSSIRRFAQADGLPSSSIMSLRVNADGSLLVLTAMGAARFSSAGLLIPAAADSETMLARLRDGAAPMLDIRVIRPALKTSTIYAAFNKTDDLIEPAQAGPGGAIWRRTATSVTEILSGIHREFRIGRDLAGSRIQCLSVDREGTAWIGTDKGLFTAAPGAAARVRRSAPLQSESVLSILQDREGNEWIGTESSGLHALRPRKFEGVSAAAGEGIATVAQASDGSIWYGTRREGLRRLQGGRENVPVPAAGLTSPVILSLAPGPRGDMWVGTPDGLNHVEHGKARRYTSADGLPDDFVRSVLVSRDGTVWAGTRSGLARLRGSKFSAVASRGSAVNRSIGPFLDASSSNSALGSKLWVGTAAGLELLDGEGAHNFLPTKNGFTSDIITAIAQGQGDNLWVGIYGGGLSRFARGRFEKVDSPDLPPRISGLAVDAAGYLWLRGSRGVYRASLAELNHCASVARACRPAVARYGTADGMPSEDLTSDGTPALWAATTGDLWFASRKGLARTEPLRLPVNRNPPPVLVERFAVDDVEQPPTVGAFKIGPGHHRFIFDYAALSYTVPSKVRYRCKLEGFDRDWIDVGARRAAYYTSLPAGSYRFRVIAENNDGVWNKIGADVSFSVLPAFYLRWWFYALSLAGVAAAAGLAFQIRFRTIRKQFALVLNERNRVAREIHDTLAQDLVSVSLQIELVLQSIAAEQLSQASEQARNARLLVKKGLEEARQSIWNLRANAARNSLPARLNDTASEFRRKHLNVRLKIGGAYRKLNQTIEDEILRIAREGLSNIDRHAGAAEAAMEMHYGVTELTLIVRDNGRGFSYDAARALDGHYGVRGMEERAAAVGGRLKVFSSLGKGTTVTLHVPLVKYEGVQS